MSANKTPRTIVEALTKFFSVHYSTKLVFRRTYDGWQIKQILADVRRRRLTRLQKLDLQAHQELGSDLAVSRFVVGYCLGKVRNQHGNWIGRYSELPKEYHESFKVTAIKAAKAGLVSEGIDNFVGLDHLQSLDLSDNPSLDDFACDQLSRQFRTSETLREINLSYNPLISISGLEILFRIPSIRRIVAIDTQASDHDQIDLFTVAAQDERQCQVFVHADGKQFKLKELEDLRIKDMT